MRAGKDSPSRSKVTSCSAAAASANAIGGPAAEAHVKHDRAVVLALDAHVLERDAARGGDVAIEPDHAAAERLEPDLFLARAVGFAAPVAGHPAQGFEGARPCLG